MDFKNISKFFILICLVFSFGCGRKSKNVFVFKPQVEEIILNRLDFPLVKGLVFQKHDQVANIFWNKVEPAFEMSFSLSGTSSIVKKKVILLGYNVYRFAKQSFVPENPVNKRPLSSNIFQVSFSKKYKWCYLVRAIFKINSKIIEGPASQIVCEN